MLIFAIEKYIEFGMVFVVNYYINKNKKKNEISRK
jgi:hypothetical protein